MILSAKPLDIFTFNINVYILCVLQGSGVGTSNARLQVKLLKTCLLQKYLRNKVT